MLTHPTGLFPETIFRPLGVLPPSNFLHTLQPLKLYFCRFFPVRRAPGGPKLGSAPISSFYRAMHFSAKRGIAIACRLSVCL